MFANWTSSDLLIDCRSQLQRILASLSHFCQKTTHPHTSPHTTHIHNTHTTHIHTYMHIHIHPYIVHLKQQRRAYVDLSLGQLQSIMFQLLSHNSPIRTEKEWCNQPQSQTVPFTEDRRTLSKWSYVKKKERRHTHTHPHHTTHTYTHTHTHNAHTEERDRDERKKKRRKKRPFRRCEVPPPHPGHLYPTTGTTPIKRCVLSL